MDIQSRRTGQTMLIVCKKCGIKTRHTWQRWEAFSLRSWIALTGGTKLVEGWQCGKCGARRAVVDIPLDQQETPS